MGPHVRPEELDARGAHVRRSPLECAHAKLDSLTSGELRGGLSAVVKLEEVFAMYWDEISAASRRRHVALWLVAWGEAIARNYRKGT